MPFAALSLIAGASPATASVMIGQLSQNPSAPNCVTTHDRLQPTVTWGNAYVVPDTGGVSAWTVTSWSHNAKATAGQTLAMKVFRKVAEPATYTAVGHDGPRPLTPSAVNTFPVSIPVKSGDVLGMSQPTAVGTACVFAVTGESFLYKDGSLADGASETFTQDPDFRLNVSAALTPVSSFTLGEVMRNKKKGNANFTVNVPNPGSLAVGGNGVKASTVTATAAGAARLPIRAKGKKRKKLNATGKVKLAPSLTYTPTGGDPGTQSASVKLKKKP